MRHFRVLLISTTLLLAALLVPSSAGAYIYWPNDTEAFNSIGRANQDGTGVNNKFVETIVSPCDVATNGTYVYWSGGEGVGYIGRANVANRAAQDYFIQTANDLNCGVAVDDSHIYFNNYILGGIGRATLDGGNVENTFIAGGINPQHPTVAGGHIYWTNKGYGCPPGCSVGRADLDGNMIDQEFIPGTHDPPSGVAVDDSHIFWGNGDFVGRSNLDGSGVNPTFLDTGDFVCDVAVDSGHLYWARYGGDEDAPEGNIGRANLDGSGVDKEFITTAGATCGVAVDGKQSSGNFRFTEVPRITCAGVCRVVLIRITFDARGRVVAEQILPNQGPVSGASVAAKKKPVRLIKKLKQSVKVGPNKLKIKLTPAGKKALKKKRSLRVKVRFTFTPAGGKPTSKVKTVRIKLSGRKN
ncbi:MAG: hypothetical protein ACSLFI_10430 [Solirubrobacterales bacterium]